MKTKSFKEIKKILNSSSKNNFQNYFSTINFDKGK